MSDKAFEIHNPAGYGRHLAKRYGYAQTLPVRKRHREHEFTEMGWM